MADKEYIEKEAAIELLRDNINLPIDSGIARAYWTRVVEIKDALIGHIAKIPSADVVEVVRCKDCKNAYINSFSAQSGVALCRFWSKRSNGELLIFQQDDFCSYGERKEATP
jgi:hypothetical protein